MNEGTKEPTVRRGGDRVSRPYDSVSEDASRSLAWCLRGEGGFCVLGSVSCCGRHTRAGVVATVERGALLLGRDAVGGGARARRGRRLRRRYGGPPRRGADTGVDLAGTVPADRAGEFEHHLTGSHALVPVLAPCKYGLLPARGRAGEMRRVRGP